jgi:Protein of unknown function (DUF3618)
MAAHPQEVTPEMIRERMADTREALAADLERLRERANPKAILRHQLSATKGRLFRAEHKALAPFHRSSASADHTDPADPADDGEAGHRGGRLRSVGSAVRRTVTARPALAAGVAAGIGVALAVILPGPRRGR